MAARIVSTLIFWILMTGLILGATVVVFGLYFPFVGLKAVYLAVTGKLSGATGDDVPGEGDVARPHIG